MDPSCLDQYLQEMQNPEHYTIAAYNLAVSTVHQVPRTIMTPYDEYAWVTSDHVADDWEDSQNDREVRGRVCRFILKHRGGEPKKLHNPIRGGYNINYRLEYLDGTSVCLRMPVIRPGNTHGYEKVCKEVATMQLVAEKTTIPVPKVYAFGPEEENDAKLGPWIIMEWIDHEMLMSDALMAPDRKRGEDHMLDPNVDMRKLEFCWRQLANIVLQLSKLEFDCIGSLLPSEQGQVSVSGRPLIQEMSYLKQMTGTPEALLPPSTYHDARSWYMAMADMHIAQFTFQHNDAVENEDDARDKYISRLLFKKLAASGCFTPGADNEPGDKLKTRLFLEDFRPSNVLVDKDLRIVGVIDWEYAYAAPTQFTMDPPWWLLLTRPEEFPIDNDYPGEYDSRNKAYDGPLRAFLSILEEEELRDEADQRNLATYFGGIQLNGTQPTGAASTEVRLSAKMLSSWENQTWLVGYAARNSWVFDLIFWRYLDPKFIGPNLARDHSARLKNLTPEEHEMMEDLVRVKMEEAKERRLHKYSAEDGRAHLARFWPDIF